MSICPTSGVPIKFCTCVVCQKPGAPDTPADAHVNPTKAERPETVEAISYENADGTLYGYANHKDWAGNPGAVPVRFLRESDYQAMVNALTAAQQQLEHAKKHREQNRETAFRLQQSLTASEKQAKRYEWLKAADPARWNTATWARAADLDAYIDAKIARGDRS